MSRAYIVSFPGIRTRHAPPEADRTALAQLELTLDDELEQLLVNLDRQESAGRELSQELQRLSVDVESAQTAWKQKPRRRAR